MLGWRYRLNDGIAAAGDELTLRTRASATLRSSARRPVVGVPFRLRGRLRAPARGVTVLLQGRAPGATRFTTFADAVTGKRGGFATRYRFREAGSSGRRFTFRAKIKPGARYPFEPGFSRGVHVRVR